MYLIQSNKNDQTERLQLLLTLSRGAKSRRNILKALIHKPKNCNRIAKEVKLDWWTVQKHLQILMSENAIRNLTVGRRKIYKLTTEGRNALKALQQNKVSV